MRVTLAMNFEKLANNINNKEGDISKLSDQLSSGKRLQAPHDDPVAWAQAMNMKQGIQQLTTFGKNMDYATNWNKATASALDSFSDLLTRAKNVALKAMKGTTPTEQAANYQDAKQMTQDGLSLANSRLGNSYIFSGQSTSTPAFDAALAYQGDTQSIQVRVGKNVHETVNQDGQTVFQTDPLDPTTNILKTLDDLATAINAGNTTTIQTQMGKIDQAFEHISSMQSIAGTRLSSLEERQNTLQSLKIDHETLLADTEGANAATVITTLQMKQTALQATLQSASFLKNLNLSSYL